MSSGLSLSDAERRRIAGRWVGITMGALHVWATALVAAAILADKEKGGVFQAMFSTVTFGIGATLMILLVDRASDIVLNKIFGVPPAGAGVVSETVTRVVETKPGTAEGESNVDRP